MRRGNWYMLPLLVAMLTPITLGIAAVTVELLRTYGRAVVSAPRAASV